MKTQSTGKIRRFRFRIAPHKVMENEYPDRYYKFRNEKVAKAFWMDSFGTEVIVKDL